MQSERYQCNVCLVSRKPKLKRKKQTVTYDLSDILELQKCQFIAESAMMRRVCFPPVPLEVSETIKDAYPLLWKP